MTTVDSKQEKVTGPPAKAGPVAQPPPKPAAAPPPAPGSYVSGVGLAVTLLALLVLGFAGYLYFLSGIQEARTQTGLYATLSGQLAKAIAPLGSPTPGAPVAVLNIPVIGMHNEVVVEGTSPENLTLGPGHLRNTPLPGQYGVSVLYGRRATFGAPFAQVPQLRPGDQIKVTTGQGTASYVVKVVGDSAGRILISGAPNQLVLMTADSTLMPSHYIEVEATLASTPQTDPGGRPAVSSTETVLANDPSSLIVTMAWGLALVIVSAAGTVAASRWSRWPAYLATVCIALSIVWNLYQGIAALLPNLY